MEGKESVLPREGRGAGGSPGEGGLARYLKGDISLKGETEALLKRSLKEGLAFYSRYNGHRLELAFSSFDEDMRHALFELIYLLNFNDPHLSAHRYTALRPDESQGVKRLVEREVTADLYVEGAPCGIEGIGSLSPVFRREFADFTHREFGRSAQPAGGAAPIVCLQSIGSIGTIGHKSRDSDLDLQVIYDLNASRLDFSQWDDGKIHYGLMVEHSWWIERIMEGQGLTSFALRQPETLHQLSNDAFVELSGSYPLLFKYIVERGHDYRADLADGSQPGLKPRLMGEFLRLVERHPAIAGEGEIGRKKAAFKERVEKIQRYIEDKYPDAEIYLFVMELEKYRAGQYTSSLDFKESSGSAYELILNQETLMPGIQFTPGIPSHFLFPQRVNDDGAFYRELNTYIRFDLLELFRGAPTMIDMGNTPRLAAAYVLSHNGAVYWEAFKASSGNLPKATLNLLRYEMLLDDHLRRTIIQLIKEPEALDGLIAPKSGNGKEDEAALENPNTGLPAWALLELMAEHPPLRQDPWWLRYLAMKIAFGEERGVAGLVFSERAQIAKMIDLAFALHIRISDVFTKPGDTRPFDSHREQVLLRFLQLAFPPGTEQRRFLEHIFIGETTAVGQFESQLRFHFRWALERAEKKIAEAPSAGLMSYNKELQLWFQYYEKNFDPLPNVPHRTIMRNLMASRHRLLIANVQDEGWVFKSIQRESQLGKRFDTFGVLDYLPDEVTLIKGDSFLFCMATCLVNGYYGIVERGSLNESRTALEFDARHMELGSKLNNAHAAVRPDQLERLTGRMLEFLQEQPLHYTDHIRKERRLTRLFVLLNFWKYGQLSLLSIDNLNVWYCDEIMLPTMIDQASTLLQDHQKLLALPELHAAMDSYIADHPLQTDELELKTWVNPTSVETPYTAARTEQAEEFLAEVFMGRLRRFGG